MYPSWDGRSIKKIDVTPYVHSWNVNHQLGKPFGTCTFKTPPFFNLEHFNRNDIVIIDQDGPDHHGRELIVAGLLNTGTENQSIQKDKITTTLDFTASEISKFLDRHELFYNQY